jgi:ribosomal-protein-alanine N-acetyltransferase
MAAVRRSCVIARAPRSDSTRFMPSQRDAGVAWRRRPTGRATRPSPAPIPARIRSAHPKCAFEVRTRDRSAPAPYAATVPVAVIPQLSTKPSARERAAGVVRVGERALLRYAREDDGPGFLAMLSRSREHLAPWMPRTARGSEPSFGRRLARMLRPASDSAGRLRLLVCARDDGRMVGVASLGGISEWPSLDCHVGYWLAAGEPGKGLMRDAVSALVDHAFEERGLHRVAANIIPHNNRSIALVRALGFTREGLLRGLIEIDGAWRDHECWSVLSTEWRGGALDRSAAQGSSRRKTSRRA